MVILTIYLSHETVVTELVPMKLSHPQIDLVVCSVLLALAITLPRYVFEVVLSIAVIVAGIFLLYVFWGFQIREKIRKLRE